MCRVRPAVMAGRFYPANPARLQGLVRGFLDQAHPPALPGPLKALIVPHAGYPYSGPIAASGYACLRSEGGGPPWNRVILLGTSHTAAAGLALTRAAVFETPLGEVCVDQVSVAAIRGMPSVIDDDDAHDQDHALEVQLPFLQVALSEAFQIVPILVGRSEPSQTCAVLDRLWGDDATLIVVSSDLSHYRDHATARALDLATARAIEALDPEALPPRAACGQRAIAGLMLAARKHDLRVTTIDLRDSSDTAGPRDEVVGYGAFAFTGSPVPPA